MTAVSFFDEDMEKGQVDAGLDEQAGAGDGDAGDKDADDVGEHELAAVHAEGEGAGGAGVGARQGQRYADEQRQAPEAVFLDLGFEFFAGAFQVAHDQPFADGQPAKEIQHGIEQEEDTPANEDVRDDADGRH